MKFTNYFAAGNFPVHVKCTILLNSRKQKWGSKKRNRWHFYFGFYEKIDAIYTWKMQ